MITIMVARRSMVLQEGTCWTARGIASSSGLSGKTSQADATSTPAKTSVCSAERRPPALLLQVGHCVPKSQDMRCSPAAPCKTVSCRRSPHPSTPSSNARRTSPASISTLVIVFSSWPSAPRRADACINRASCVFDSASHPRGLAESPPASLSSVDLLFGPGPAAATARAARALGHRCLTGDSVRLLPHLLGRSALQACKAFLDFLATTAITTRFHDPCLVLCIVAKWVLSLRFGCVRVRSNGLPIRMLQLRVQRGVCRRPRRPGLHEIGVLLLPMPPIRHRAECMHSNPTCKPCTAVADCCVGFAAMSVHATAHFAVPFGGA